MSQTFGEDCQSEAAALMRELGPDGLYRFIALFFHGTGDYTKERRNQPEKSLNEIMAEIEELRAKGLIPSCNERKDT